MLALAGALVLSVVPGIAAAKPGCGSGPTVPSGSEIDQYAQSIPGACGNQENGGSSGGGGGSSEAGGGAEDSGSSDSVITPSTRERLQDLGAAGAGAQTLADENAPRIENGERGSRGGGSPGAAGGGQSQPGAVVGAAIGSGEGGGMGLVLPLILLAVTAGGALYVARKRASQAS
jgi:hypothetical protein